MNLSSSKPSVSISKVPSVRQLCELLGFQHASLKETNAFMEATRSWRKAYTTNSGRPGAELRDWNNVLDQLELKQMAEEFIGNIVENRENGNRFWSPSRSWNHDSDLVFPEDKIRIVELLKQLFWKQNRYAYNNSHYIYGQNKDVETRETSREKTTPVRQTGHEAHSAPPLAGSSTPEKRTSVHAISSSPKNPSPRDKDSSHMTQTSANSPATVGRVDPNTHDVWEIPSDSDSHTNATAVRSHKRPQPSTTGATPPKKRKKRKSQETISPRRTDRRPAVRNIPGKVPDDQVEQFINLSEEPETDTQPRGEQNVHFTEPHMNTGLTTHPPPSSISNRYAPTAPMLEKRKSLSPRSKFSKRSRVTSHFDSNKHTKIPSLPFNSSNATQKLKSSEFPPRIQTKKFVESEKGNSADYQSIYNSNSTHEAAEDMSPSTLVTSKDPALNSPQDLMAASNEPTKPAEIPSVPDTVLPDTESIDKNLNEPSALSISAPTSKPTVTSEKPDPARQSPSQTNLSKPRQKTQIPLWIITREPRYTEERWDDGKFMGTPLAAFLEGISKITQRNHIEKIKLTLRAPTFDTKITVFKDADDSWASAKETFVEKLKEAKAEARTKRQEQVSFKILVEPFYEEGFALIGSADEDEEEFEF